MKILTAEHGELDPATNEGLISILDSIESNPRGWISRTATSLLRFVELELATVARASGAEPEDAAREAWLFWTSGRARACDDLWAYTAKVVGRALAREDEAQRKLTSTRGLRRLGARAARVDRSSFPDRPAGCSQEPARETQDLGSTGALGLAPIRQFLIMAGFTAEHAQHVVETVGARAGESRGLAAACDRLSRDHMLGQRLGMGALQWRALVTLALGTTRGRPGLYALAASGHPDPMRVSYIRRASQRFLSGAETEAVL